LPSTRVPAPFADDVAQMRKDHLAVLEHLRSLGVEPGAYPCDLEPAAIGVPAAARAYPIQGILKYHGMADWHWRTAYLPSISITSDAASTLTRVTFDSKLPSDLVRIGGEEATGRERERVIRLIQFVRELGGFMCPARVDSRNTVRGSKTGKGLGTSASASAALAAAALAAAFGWETARNQRLLSTTARLLAGSGCRSATGGLSLWLSYPGIAHKDSYSVRLDQEHELEMLRLVTVPIASRIGLKTEQAHRDAPQSSLFRGWMETRRREIIECTDAAVSGDWQGIAALGELDSIRLHGVTMSGTLGAKIIAWEPENITLFRLCNALRAEGVPVFYNTDTGPTTVFLTDTDHVSSVVDALGSAGFETIAGRLAGPVESVDAAVAEKKLSL